MIRKLDLSQPAAFASVLAIINEAAQAYRGVIPAECWHEPYMPAAELQDALREGVRFWGCTEDGELVGVMGIQDVQDVTLIRHAYVRPQWQGRGIGSRLLEHLLALAERPVLIGTWRDAAWAVRFYQRHGFSPVSAAEKDRLLRRYWSVPPHQIRNSVVLARPTSRLRRPALAPGRSLGLQSDCLEAGCSSTGAPAGRASM